MKKRRAPFSSTSLTAVSTLLLIASVFTYLYFLNQSVIHVVMREELEQSIHERQTTIAALEARLIEAQFTITERVAALDDYQTEPEKLFVMRGESNLVLRPR
jgi:hypothetical protein